MTFHTRSVAELGHLFTDLTVKLTQEDLSATLEMLRIFFNAEAILILVEWKKGENVYREMKAESGSPLTLERVIQDNGAVFTPNSYIGLQAVFFDTEDAARFTIFLFKPDNQEKFDDDDQILADLIVAQIGRYLKRNYYHSNMERERNLYTNLVDRFEVGIILLDNKGHVFSVSERANQFLEKRDGLLLINHRLSATSAADNNKLQTLINDAISDKKGSSESPGKGMSLSKKSSDKTLSVLVRRIPNIEHAWQGAVSIYIRDSDTAPDVGAELMRQVFDLTPAESEVARLLATGLSLEETATDLDITRNTARAHLRSIFSKSGINRQTELVRLVLNSAVVL